MTTDGKSVRFSTEQEHNELISIMSKFIDNGIPKVGIFWYDIANNSLFGTEKIDAEKVV